MKKVSKGTPLRKNAWIMTFSCEEERKFFCDDIGYGCCTSWYTYLRTDTDTKFNLFSRHDLIF